MGTANHEDLLQVSFPFQAQSRASSAKAMEKVEPGGILTIRVCQPFSSHWGWFSCVAVGHRRVGSAWSVQAKGVMRWHWPIVHVHGQTRTCHIASAPQPPPLPALSPHIPSPLHPPPDPTITVIYKVETPLLHQTADPSAGSLFCTNSSATSSSDDFNPRWTPTGDQAGFRPDCSQHASEPKPSTSRRHWTRESTAACGRLYENRAWTNQTYRWSHNSMTDSEQAYTRTSKANTSTSSGAPNSFNALPQSIMKPFSEKWSRDDHAIGTRTSRTSASRMKSSSSAAHSNTQRPCQTTSSQPQDTVTSHEHKHHLQHNTKYPRKQHDDSARDEYRKSCKKRTSKISGSSSLSTVTSNLILSTVSTARGQRQCNLKDRLKLFDAMATPSLLYASGTWTMTEEKKETSHNTTKGAEDDHTTKEKDLKRAHVDVDADDEPADLGKVTGGQKLRTAP